MNIVYKIVGLALCATIFTACDVLEQNQGLTKKGTLGYEYCLKHPTEKLYMGDDIYSCEYYLLFYKDDYDHTPSR